MAVYTRQTLVRVVDPEVSQLSGQTGKNNEQTNAQFIVVTTPAMSLSSVPTISIGGSEVTLGAVGSGAEYEYKRISATQTLIIKNTFATAITKQGEYNPEITYELNDSVITNTGIWYSQISSNTGNVPETSPDDWASTPYVPATATNTTSQGSWISDSVYAINDAVRYLGITWYSQLSDNTGNVPKAGSMYWSSVPINTTAPVIVFGVPAGIALPIGEAVIGTSLIVG